jgi:hypothetical protein
MIIFILQAILVVFAGTQARAAVLVLERGVLTVEQEGVAQQLLYEAEQLLPKLILGQLQQHRTSIPIQFADLSVEGKNKKLGLSSGRKILLNPIILNWYSDHSRIAVSTDHHPNGHLRAVATVLHEVAHVFDALNLHQKEEEAYISHCSDLENLQRDTRCSFYQRRQYSVSQDPNFLNAAGWIQGRIYSSRGSNHLIWRSSDPYELTSPQEYFAVNFEYFLLDAEFQCRKPGVYRYYRERLSYEPFPQVSCSSRLYYLDAEGDSTEQAFKFIDFSRVYSIHYLLASGGSSLMSRWGHSMLRVVICAPERTSVSEECLKDVHYHLVLSARALVTEMQISSFAGISGRYPSRFFILPLSKVIKEYTQGEWRDLESYPLALEPSQMTDLLKRATELHWTYDGKYYFLTNNCAIETLHLITGAGINEALLGETAMTPRGVLELLERSGIIREKLPPREEAATRGYLFDSYRGRYELAFQQIAHFTSAPNFETYFKENGNVRGQIIANALNLANVAQKRSRAAALLILESGIRIQIEKEAIKIINEILLNAELTKTPNSEYGSLIAKRAENMGLIGSPGAFLAGVTEGYGIPTEAELNIAKSRLQDLATSNTQLGTEYRELFDKVITEQFAAKLKSVSQNMKFLLNKMNQ